MTESFRVALTSDFRTPDGRMGWGDIGLDALDNVAGVTWDVLDVDGLSLPAGALADVDAVLVLGPRVDAESLRQADRLKVVARFGVGYDSVDIDACTAAGVIVTITPDGVRRPVAAAGLALLLAAAHRLKEKDRLVRTGLWHDKLDYMGVGLTGKTLGFVGWGNIGRELSRLAGPLQMRQVAADPHADPTVAADHGVTLLDLDEMLAEADFVVVTAALTEQTYHLLNAQRLARMRSGAFLINIARGPLVDQAALTDALASGRLAGAALDVFDPEPPADNDPLLALDNVLFTPHAAAWTDEMAIGNGSSAIRGILEAAAGRRPDHIVNPQALAHPRWAHLPPTARKASP